MKVKIDDVAKDAGVSIATVSRYLNQSPMISEKSKKKVKKSMDKLNYRPSFLAQSLAGVITHTIAFVIDSENEKTYGNEFFAKIQFGVEKELSNQGFYMLVISIDNQEKGTRTLQKMIMEKRIEGAILPIELLSDSMASYFEENSFPFAIIGQHSDSKINCADINNLQGANIAMQALIDKGSRKIAYVSPEYNNNSLKISRFTGYQQALKRNNLTFSKRLVKSDCNNALEAKEFGQKIINKEIDVDGILCTDNKIAFSLVQYLVRKGVNIPEDIQIICFDNTDLTEISNPAISAVDIDLVALGKVLAKKVLGSFKSDKKVASMELINVSLILRDTTKE